MSQRSDVFLSDICSTAPCCSHGDMRLLLTRFHQHGLHLGKWSFLSILCYSKFSVLRRIARYMLCCACWNKSESSIETQTNVSHFNSSWFIFTDTTGYNLIRNSVLKIYTIIRINTNQSYLMPQSWMQHNRTYRLIYTLQSSRVLPSLCVPHSLSPRGKVSIHNWYTNIRSKFNDFSSSGANRCHSP